MTPPNTELELELELDLELEPDVAPETTGDVEIESEPAVAQLATVAVPLIDVLPADFQIPLLTRFVPDVRLKQAADAAAERALSIDVTGPEGLAKADVAVTELRDAINAMTATFDEPAAIANKLHKHITGQRSEWARTPSAAKATVDQRIVAEDRRLKAIEAEQARAEQERADAAAREQAKKDADAAAKSNAPAAVVEEMKQRAATATAPPVPRPAIAPVLRNSTTVSTWKCRIKGTPGDAEPNPAMDALTPAQKVEVLALMKDVVEGKQPITCFEIAWSRLNNRAKGEKATMEITGIEAYEHGSTRAKARRS